MRTNRLFSILFLLAWTCFHSGHAQVWTQLPDFPAAERDDGVCFAIGNKAWCGTGLQVGWVTGADFYCLDLSTETWLPSAAMPPGMERQYACAFTDGIHGYVAGGVNASGTVLNDLWMYDTTGNTWISKTPKPGTLLAACASFVIGDTAYVVGGNNNLGVDASKEVWAYSFSGDSWTRKADTPFLGRWRASACALGNKGYLGLGRDENGAFCREIYEYEPLNDSWQQLTAIPGAGRNYAAMVSDGTDLLMFGGIDTTGYCYNGVYRYTFTGPTWAGPYAIPTQVGRKGGMCFFANSNLYYTCGIDSASTRLRETWKYGQPTGLSEEGKAGLQLYPNPVSESIHLHTARSGDQYRIYDAGMRLLLSGQLDGTTDIHVPGLSAGLYILQFQQQADVYTTKFMKE